MHKYLLIILLALFHGVGRVDGIEERETGVGFQVTPIGFCLSGRFLRGDLGYRVVGGIWIDDGEQGIRLGGGLLYKIRKWSRVDGHFGAEILYEWEEDKTNLGIGVLAGIEYFPQHFHNFGFNVEIGQYLNFGLKPGMGVHYYF